MTTVSERALLAPYAEPTGQLVLLEPTGLPTSRADLTLASAMPAFRHLDGWLAGEPATAVELLAATRSALDAGWPVARPAPPWTHGSARPEDYADHDAFFGVRRVQGSAGPLYWRGVLQAYSALLEETVLRGTTLEPRWWQALLHGLGGTGRYCAGLAPEPPAAHPVPQRTAADVQPRVRWRLGHHLFFVLTQSIVVSFSCFAQAAAAGDTPAATRALGSAGDQMWAAGAALRFACDFHPDAYRFAVRPSMMPPHLPEGFSGLQARDHHHLVTLMGRLRPLLTSPLVQLEGSRGQLVDALENLYDSHAFVCGRFDGAAVPSLRMGESSDLTAVDVIHRLMRSRRKLLAGAPLERTPAPRGADGCPAAQATGPASPATGPTTPTDPPVAVTAHPVPIAGS